MRHNFSFFFDRKTVECKLSLLIYCHHELTSLANILLFNKCLTYLDGVRLI